MLQAESMLNMHDKCKIVIKSKSNYIFYISITQSGGPRTGAFNRGSTVSLILSKKKSLPKKNKNHVYETQNM